MIMKQYIIDAFTKELFKGNPAAVCVMDSWIPDELMLNIAKENNISETAFCVKEGSAYHLRWFTPAMEIDFCGHATLATSFVLLNYYETSTDHVDFDTLHGRLSVKRFNDSFEMNFPAYEYANIPVTDDMEKVFGVRPSEALLGRELVCVFGNESIVKNMNPNPKSLLELGYFGYCVTAPGSEYDCVSRYFSPELSIPEDPVTGSIHCLLAPYWAKRLGKPGINAFQASKRTGTMRCVCEEDRVKIYGDAVLFNTSVINIC